MTLEMTITEGAAWFDARAAGLYGGLIGAGIGTLLGGVGGPMAGVLAPQGKAKGLVVGWYAAFFVLGVAMAITGLTALVMAQPYHVWFVFFMPGVLCALLTGILLPVVLKRYAMADQQKMDAEALRSA